MLTFVVLAAALAAGGVVAADDLDPQLLVGEGLLRCTLCRYIGNETKLQLTVR